MSIATLKALIWAASAAVFGYLGWFVYTWTVEGQQEERMRSRAPTELMKRVLDEVPEPEPPRTALVDYDAVVANFHELNWTGREAPRPAPAPAPVQEEPAAKPRPEVAKLLRVLYVQVDESKPESSITVVQYENAQLTAAQRTPVDLKVGDRLHRPFEIVRVHAIKPEGVEFVAEGYEEDPPELVRTWSNFGPGIRFVGEEGFQMPTVAQIPRAPERIVGRPERTVERRPGLFVLGERDMETFERDHLAILSNEVRHRQYRDPRTRQWGGIEVLEVAPGSLVAQHGVKSGDVIKSINGSPVNSVQEAISYVKNNQKLYNVWEVVVANAGKERTLTFHSQ
jgi:hypothetical protein